MNEIDALVPRLNRFQRWSLIGGIGALILSLAGAFFDLERFFQTYLFGYLFWLQIALGCLIFLMLHHLAGGRWSFAIRRLLEAAAMTLPLLALLFAPILFGLPILYPWARSETVAASELLQHKSPYLNVPFFIGRAIVYFIVWAGSAYLLNRWSAQQDKIDNPARLTRRFRIGSSLGLVFLGLTLTFAAIDWMMSLEPLWFSTMYGFIFVSGALAAGLAFIIIPASILAYRSSLAEIPANRLFNDLGNFLLAAVMFWAYIAISQYLIIWSGNLPEEIPWYIHRSEGGWQWVVIVLTVSHFLIPFLLLLSRSVKRKAAVLTAIAGLVVLARLVDLFWLVKPAFNPSQFSVHWLDLVIPFGLGGVWIAVFIWQLKTKPLLAVYDPRIGPEVLKHGPEEVRGGLY